MAALDEESLEELEVDFVVFDDEEVGFAVQVCVIRRGRPDGE